MPATYRIRPATLGDLDVLVRQRIGMFNDMGVQVSESVGPAFRDWLADTMPSGTYRAWLTETETNEVAAGGGLTILPWPPGPRYPTGRPMMFFGLDMGPKV